MANTIPCPNPICTHDFSAAELQAATSLQCPKCGFRMQGKTPAASKAAAPTKPPAAPTKPPGPAPAKPAAAPSKPPAAAPAKPAEAPPKPVAPVTKPIPVATPPAAKPIAPAPANIAVAQPIAATATTTGKIVMAMPVQPSAGGDAPFANLSAPPAKPIAPAPKIAAATPVEPSVDGDSPFAGFTNTPPKPVAKPTPAAAPAPAAPVAPTRAISTASAAKTAPPVSSEDSIPDGTFFNPDIATTAAAAAALVHAKKAPKKKFDWHRFTVLSLTIGFSASIVITAIVGVLWFFLGWGARDLLTGPEGNVFHGTIRGPKDTVEKVYKLVLPKNEWAVDNEIQNKFNAHAAWKHTEYDFWFAIVVKDYIVHKPRDAEMVRLSIEKLESYFVDSIELSKKPEASKIAGLDAVKIQFKGQYKATNWVGECYMFFKDGIAYWLYLASPEWENVVAFAEILPKDNFFVSIERRGWREQPPPTETFISINGMITMTAPKGVWEKFPAKDEDEAGELFLAGRYLKEKDNRKNALMLLFTIEKQPDLKDALKVAREQIEGKTKKDNPNNKVVHANDVAEGQTEAGTLEDIGNRRGRILDLKLQFMDEPKRYYLLAVVNEPDICYAILCDCTWESRHIWRQDFIDLLRTFRLGKKME